MILTAIISTFLDLFGSFVSSTLRPFEGPCHLNPKNLSGEIEINQNAEHIDNGGNKRR